MNCDHEMSAGKAAVVVFFLVGLVALMAMAMCNTGSKSTPLPTDRGAPQAMMAPAVPGQLAAFGQNSMSLPMGVTLVGKGYVDSVVPGSPAERAGIQVGDIINRINGR